MAKVKMKVNQNWTKQIIAIILSKFIFQWRKKVAKEETSVQDEILEGKAQKLAHSNF